MADIRIIPSDGLVNVTGSINFKGTGGSTMLFITGSSGNIGIGTTNPGHKLDVSGSVRLGGTEAQALPIKMGWDANAVYMGGPNNNTINTGYDTNSDYNLHINYVGYQGSTTRYRNLVINDGKQALIAHFDGASRYVGIGTFSPNAPLHIIKDLGTSVSAVARLRGSNSTARTTRLQFEDYNGTIADGLIDFIIPTGGSSTGARLDVGVDSAIMSLVKGGNVGIGTTSPSYKLDVSGQIRVNNGVSNGSGQALIVGGSGDVTLTDGGSLFFGAYDYGGSTYIRGYDGGDIMYFYSNGTNMGYFRSDRAYFAVNTGIGTSSPSTRLHVSGGDAILRNAYIGEVPTYGAANSQFSHISRAGAGEYSFLSDSVGETYVNAKTGYNINFRVNNSNVAIITSAGNIGIGTTNPSYKLDVEGSVNGELRAASFVNSNTGTSAYNEINLVANDATLRLGVTNTNYPGQWTGGGAYFLAPGGMFFGPGNDYKLSVLANGNVGIGLTNPIFKLDIAGGDDTNSFRVYGNSTFGPAVRIQFTGTGGKAWNLISNSSNNSGGLGALQFWNSTDSVTAMVILPAGNVGIGTDAPTNKLQVVGGVTATSFTGSLLGNASTATSASFATTAATAATATSATSATTATTATNVAWTGVTAGRRTNYDLGFEAPSTGYAGFSFTTPGGAAENAGYFLIRGGADNDVYTQNGITLVADAGWLTLAQRTTAGKGVRIMTGTTSVERVTVLEGGNVGIGTTTPSQKLHVNGSAYLQSGNLFLTQGNYITWNSGDNYIKGISGYHLQFTTYDGSAAQVEVLRLTGGTAASGGARVGIGTSVPIAKLHVSGSSGSLAFNVEGSQGQLFSVTDSLSGSLMSVNDISGLPILEVFSDDRVIGGKFGSNALSISGSNVGIGAYNPARKLDVYDAASQIVAQFSSSNATSVRIKFSDANTGAENVNIGAIGTRMALWTNNAERVSILSGGNVGIGTTSPAFPLHVVGYARASGFSVNDGSGTVSAFIGYEKNWIGSGTSATLAIAAESQKINFYAGGTTDVRMMVSSSGNIGIGTTNPSYRLHVAGTSWFEAEQSISYTNSIQSMYGGSGYSLFRMYGASNAVEMQVDTHSHNANAATLGTYSNHDVFIKTNQTNKMVVKAGGNVGIGITNPNTLLDVAGGINTRNSRVNAGEKVPVGHYTPGETVFEIDPTWTQAQLQDFFNSSGVTWTADSTAPGGYAIQIDGAINVAAGTYNSGFPFIPVDSSQDDWFYMECWIRNEAGSTIQHYMGGIDYNESFTSLGGNPGSFTYNVMLNYNPGTSWTKVFGYWNGFGNSYGGSGTGNTNNWKAGTKYFTPQALFNYGFSGGTRRCYISGWKCVRVRATGNRYYANNVLVSGSVGIGTTSPGSRLDITKEDGGQQIFRVRNYATSATGNFTGNYAAEIRSAYDTGATGGALLVHTQEASDARPTMAVSDSNGVFTTFVNGKVGIGTTNPGFKLDVSGSIRTLTGYIQGANSSADITIDGNIGTLLRYGTQKLLLNSSNAILYTADTIRLFIDNAGLIGIGTTSPTQLLHIQGANAGNNGISLQNTNASGNSQVRFLNTSGTERAAITYVNSADAVYHYTAGGGNLFNLVGGNVGIGTATPAVLLHLYGSGNTFTRYTNTSNSGHYVDIGANSAGESFIYGYGAYPVLFGTNGSEKMRILSNGNVGIGTTAPTHLLHVSGGGIRIQGTGPVNSLRLDDTGGTSRNAMYVSSSNYLVIDNINYTGLQLVHTGSAPTPNDGNGITSYYGTDERFYLAEPNNWLAIRINTTNYVIPMYQV